MRIKGYFRSKELLQSVRLTSLLSIIITALLLILIFTILLPFRIDKNSKQENYNTNSNSYALLITMYCTEERKAMYLDILTYIRDDIGWPLKDLYIVDSANNGVPHTFVAKENQILYDQDLVDLNLSGPSPTIYEQFALSRVTEKLWDKFAQYDYIIKMTGKYKPKNLLSILRRQLIQEDCILSFYSDKARFREGQIYTEIVGFRSDIFREWVSWIQNNMLQSSLEMKTDIFTRRRKLVPHILPRIKNEADYERSDQSTILYI